MNRSEHFLIGDARHHAAELERLRTARRIEVRPAGIALEPDTYDGEALFKIPFPRVKRTTSPRAAASSCRTGGS